MLVFGGSFNAARGAVMSTANAYLQADMVGVSSDVSGIVAEVTVHSNRKVAKRRAVQSLRTAVQPMDRAGR